METSIWWHNADILGDRTDNIQAVQKEWSMSMDRKRLVPPNILGVRNAVITTDVDKLIMINGQWLFPFFMGTLSSHIVLNLQFWRTSNLYPVTQTTSNHQNDENEHLLRCPFVFFGAPKECQPKTAVLNGLNTRPGFPAMDTASGTHP